MSHFSRRDFILSALAATSLSTCSSSIGSLPRVTNSTKSEEFSTASGEAPLKVRAASKGILYGAMSHYRYLTTDDLFAHKLASECAILVPGAEFNWKNTYPEPDRFDFSKSDWLVDFSRSHEMLIRGHTLVWHKDTSFPSWFSDKLTSRNAEGFLQNYINSVVGRYRGQLHSWDVVNEAINVNDGRQDNLRYSPWLNFLGTQYIENAFRLAHEADPTDLLVYNDFGICHDTRGAERKREAILELLSSLKSKNVPVHALGIQGHLLRNRRDLDAGFSGLRDFLNSISRLDLKILVTELDVADDLLPKDINLRDRIIAATYEEFLSVVLLEPSVIGVLTWGLSDKYTWLSYNRPRRDELPVRPLPLDESFSRKPAWHALAKAFDSTFSRSN